MLSGLARLLGDNISGDHIISKEHIRMGLPLPQMVPYLFYPCRPGLGETLRPGDILVAGENFGCGSSREYVLLLLKEAGIKCVVAKSFARGFYRGAVNQGLLPVTAALPVEENDMVVVDTEKGTVQVENREPVSYPAFPPLMQALLEAGGLIPYYKQHGALE